MYKPNEASSPFFLVGSVRSGTTLLRLMLGHHPDVCRCEEMEYLVPGILASNTSTGPREYRRFLRSDRGFKLSGYQIVESRSLNDLANSFFEQRRAIDRRPVVGATVHHGFEHLLEFWPNARFIYLKRDPRDVARSCVRMGWAGTAWKGAEFWINAQNSWSKVCVEVPSARRIELKFEDLVHDPEGVLADVCAFLSVDFAPSMLMIEEDTTYRRPSSGESDSWQESASPRDVAEVEARIGGTQIRDSGYEVSDLPPLATGRLFRTRIAVSDVMNRVRFRQKRYGFWLWLAGVLSRRSGVRSLRETVQRRIDVIDNLHLK